MQSLVYIEKRMNKSQLSKQICTLYSQAILYHNHQYLMFNWLILKRRIEEMSIKCVNKQIIHTSCIFHNHQYLMELLVEIEERNEQNFIQIN